MAGAEEPTVLSAEASSDLKATGFLSAEDLNASISLVQIVASTAVEGVNPPMADAVGVRPAANSDEVENAQATDNSRGQIQSAHAAQSNSELQVISERAQRNGQSCGQMQSAPAAQSNSELPVSELAQWTQDVVDGVAHGQSVQTSQDIMKDAESAQVEQRQHSSELVELAQTHATAIDDMQKGTAVASTDRAAFSESAEQAASVQKPGGSVEETRENEASARLLYPIPERPPGCSDEVTVDVTGEQAQQPREGSSPKPGDTPPNLLDMYASCIIKCPAILLGVYLVFFGVLIGILHKPISFEVGWESFKTGNGEERMLYESITDAIHAGRSPASVNVSFFSLWGASSENSSSSNSGNSSATKFGGAIEVFYVARDGDALNEAMLWEVRRFEQELRGLPSWQKMCDSSVESEQLKCNPGMSLVSILWAQQVDPTSRTFKFDGTGQTSLNLVEVLGILYARGNHTTYLAPNMSLESWAAGGTLSKSFALRSTFQFRGLAANAGYEAFAIKEVLPFLKERRHAFDTFTIVYGGDAITKHEYWDAFYTDCLWSLGSMLFILIYMWLQTWSLALSIAGLLIVLASIPLGLGLLPAGDISITNVFAIFLMLGIGADNLFVFTQFWAQSKAMSSELEQRLAWTIKKSAVGCLATSTTTAASFLANLASVIRPLREFGVVVGGSVIGSYVMMCLLLPPIFFLQEKGCRQLCRYCCEPIKRRSQQARAAAENSSSGRLRLLAQHSRRMVDNCKPPRMQRPGDASISPNGIQRFIAILCRFLVRGSFSCLVFYTLATGGFVAGILLTVKLDLEMPGLLPESSNYAMFQQVDANFKYVGRDDSVLANGAMCTPDSWNLEGCYTQKCEMGAKGISMNARCYSLPLRLASGQKVSQSGGVDSCKYVKAQMRAAGRQDVAENVWEGLKQSWLAILPAGNVSLEQDSPMVPRRLEVPLLLEDWESGQVETQFVYDTLRTMVERQNGVLDDCELRSICFLDEHRCDMPGWQLVGSFALPNASRPAPMRPFAVDDWPSSLTVSVAWGVIPASGFPLLGKHDLDWSYDQGFDLEAVWSQRAVYKFCTEDLVAEYADGVRNIDCWIADLRNWLSDQGLPFPSRNLARDVMAWQTFPDLFSVLTNGTRSVMLNENKDRVIASEVTFSLRKPKQSDQATIAAMLALRRFLVWWNGQAPEGVNKALAFSVSAVDAEFNKSMVSSTIMTVCISLAIAFMSMLCFTFSPILALYVTLLVLAIMTSLLFFMTCVMQWSIGPLQVLSLIVFVGYSVTYSLHIAHSYHNVDSQEPMMWLVEARVFNLLPEQSILENPLAFDPNGDIVPMKLERDIKQGKRLRVAKAILAVHRLGPAVLSSAVSTVGAGCFLLGCTLTVFPQMGVVIMAVTIFSLLAAMVILPALLMLAGPTPGCIGGVQSPVPQDADEPRQPS
eukprot:TRINITY_DN27224_c0_g1_i1.p1 TRINITY_DN27224_c0_g1~~TRINITY_DN27224_c0_g1_i1.p1  ORF type:complete len:1438 (+),score=253.19 TRINITY_DN27224_c0_g1_i1:34-4314(+)